jgi:hypothetical protein
LLYVFLYIFPDGMCLFLEFKTEFSIAENKRCLPRVVDCSKFSQVFVLLLWCGDICIANFNGIFFACFQSSCSSASPSYVSEDYLSSEVDHILDRVIEDLIDEAAAVVASENIWYVYLLT